MIINVNIIDQKTNSNILRVSWDLKIHPLPETKNYIRVHDERLLIKYIEYNLNTNTTDLIVVRDEEEEPSTD